MKQIWKKIVCISILAVFTLSLAACGNNSQESAATALDETTSATFATQSQGLVETIVGLSDDEIESYKNSGDAFTEDAMDVWENNKGDLGDFVECKEAEVDSSTDGYTVVVPASFSKLNADFTIAYDSQGTPTSISIDVIKTLGMKLEQAALNTLMGVGIVFLMLLFLSFIISLFKHIGKFEDMLKNRGKKEVAAPAETAAPVKQNSLVDENTESNNEELIAVIAAAIAAAEGTSTDAFVVRSIKKSRRNKW